MDSIYTEPHRLIPNFKVEVCVRILAEMLDYNHRLMNIPEMWKRTTGKDVKVAVLDTGLPNHPDLHPAGSHSFVEGYLEDKCGHSTHCGGIIAAIANNGMGVAGIAPDCDDYYVAVLDGDGSGTIEAIINGIHYAVDAIGADVISMSLGIEAGAPYLAELENACNYAVDRGCTVAAAAGNEYGKVGQPAMYDSVLAVAAVDSKEQHADFSNSGPEVDFATGGVNVFSTYLNQSYAKLSGTSMATPALVGAATLIVSDSLINSGKKLTPAEVKEKLKKIAYNVAANGPGYDELEGFGIPLFRKDDGGDPVIIPPPTPTIAKPQWCPRMNAATKAFRTTYDKAIAGGASKDAAMTAGITVAKACLIRRKGVQ